MHELHPSIVFPIGFAVLNPLESVPQECTYIFVRNVITKARLVCPEEWQIEGFLPRPPKRATVRVPVGLFMLTVQPRLNVTEQ